MLERALPEYMAIGMSPDEFWNGDPALCKAYRAAWKRKQENADRERWALGAYVYNAVGAAVGTVLGGNGGKPVPYLEEPFCDTQRREEEHQGTSGAVAWMQAFATQHNAYRHEKMKRQREMGASAASQEHD